MSRLRMRIWLGLAASVGFLSPLSAQAPSSRNEAPLRKPDRATIATLQKRLPELMKEATVPGVSLVLIRGGKTYVVGNFGVRDAKSQQSVTDDTIFEAASLSKPLLAYGALKLVDQGKLDLDASLTHYLRKPYIEGDARLEMITARYILSHRTGFPNWRGDGNPLTIRFTPGERFSYSGEGFVLLNKEGLNQSTLKAMEQPQIAVNPECMNCTDRQPKELSKAVFWGLGVGIQRTKEGESLWHWGDNGAFKCFIVAYPKQKIGLVLFTNGENGLSIASEVVRDALGGDQPAFDWIKYDR
ncbi:MAG TPA: serine hydrolase domain-containing protein, partial [Candidatus Sulfotelmatobacter sp.]|nr:serine hydrolase domain-containing protein [Candidatus Sulfotelmatobacter sp.]